MAIVTLIAQIVLEDRDQMSEDELVGELLSVGYAEEEIDAAFRWIETAAIPSRQPVPHFAAPTNRVFSVEEVRGLSAESRGYLLRLRAMGILDDEIHEEIVERALQMAEEDEVGLKDLKTVIALSLFSRSHDQWRHEVECLFEDDWSRMYH
jgi:Smg protein